MCIKFESLKICMAGKFIVETDHANLKWLCSIAPHKDKLRHAGYPHLLNTILNYVTALVAVTHSCCPFTLRRNPVYPVWEQCFICHFCWHIATGRRVSLLGHFTGTNSILLRPSYAYHLIFFEEGPCPNNGRYKHFSPHQSRASLNYQSDSRTPYSPVIQQTRLHDSSTPRLSLKAQPQVSISRK